VSVTVMGWGWGDGADAAGLGGGATHPPNPRVTSTQSRHQYRRPIPSVVAKTVPVESGPRMRRFGAVGTLRESRA